MLRHDDPQTVALVAEALRAGGAVVIPTDTVYGLAARAADPGATARLFELKGRAAEVPLAALCADVDQALALCEEPVPPSVRAVAERWWPGPLTLVLPRRAGLDLQLGEPESTIGVRVPDHALVRAVAREVGPVAATSANRHGEPTPATAAEVSAALGPGVALVIDGGPLVDRASTVVDATQRPWRVLREGPIAAVDILATAGAAHDDGR
jgi:L-threonylcarbamoyladenylate synthase